jgi:uncharacterized protein (DUF924 family)
MLSKKQTRTLAQENDLTETINEILSFWFGGLDDCGMSASSQHSLWFTSSVETDQICRKRFGRLVEQAVAGELDHWSQTDSGIMALTILLDQLPRNIYRGTPDAFSGDEKALELAQTTIVAGRHQHLPAIHQVFLLLPLEHCENLDIQEESVELFSELTDIAGSEAIAGFSRYAVAHRDVIAQFGRFPHRNAILGRASSQEELEYLATHGGF